MKRTSGEESERRWKILKGRASTQNHDNDAKQSAADTDPFDCSDLVVRTSQALVDEALSVAVKQWKDLEQRKVVPVVEDVVEQDSSSRSKKRRAPGEKVTWGCHAHRLQIPEFFDYACREPNPPPDDGTGDRVVSLEDTSRQVSLEGELWKIFHAVPTVQDLEASALEGAKCRNMRALHTEMTRGIQQHSRMDCHALCRLRMSDRHGLPAYHQKDSNQKATTIRLECWRRHIRRGSSPDAGRLEMEFLGSQMLQDVHDAIVELSNDELWDDSKQRSNDDAAGVFFIEDTFYTSGSVDYSSNIITWLGDGKNPGPPLRSFLGLPLKEPLKVETMSSVRLEQLNWRLGIRYYHCHHGDVECSLFLTDIRHGPISSKTSYPIIHDVWSPSYSMTQCEACRHNVGVHCASSSNELTDGGPRALCEMCHEQLYPLGNGTESNVVKYSVWRDQVDLSVGHQEPGVSFQDRANA